MVISIVYFEGCLKWPEAVKNVRRALARIGHEAQVVVRRIDEPAVWADFPGSPTVLVDGRDVVPAPTVGGQACRLYPTDNGLRGAPSLEQVMTAIRKPAPRTVKEG